MLDCDPLPPFVSPGFEHEPSALCLHPLAEPVRLCAPAVIGLICSLWHLLLFLEN
jgi:hypothetical protein